MWSQIGVAGRLLTVINITDSEVHVELSGGDCSPSSKLAFGLQYYKPSNGSDSDDNVGSGAYIFKPKMEDQNSYPYSAYNSYSVQNQGTVAAAFIFNFKKDISDKESEAYQV